MLTLRQMKFWLFKLDNKKLQKLFTKYAMCSGIVFKQIIIRLDISIVFFSNRF